MLILIGVRVPNDTIVMKACCLDMECFFLLFLLDFNDRIEKVLSESIDVVHHLNTYRVFYVKMNSRQPRYTKPINLNVRQEFELPAVYTKGSISEIEEALVLGATVQNSVKTRRANDDLRRLTDEKDAEIQRIQTSYQDRITKMTEELTSLGSEKAAVSAEMLDRIKGAAKAERDACSKENEESIRLLRKEHDVLVARYEMLESRKQVLEESRSEDIQEAVKRTEELMGRVVASKEQQLVKMEAAYARLQDSIVKQSEEIAKLSSNLGKRAANVKTKGNDYEEQFGEKLKRFYGLSNGFGLRSTGLGAGHEMDFAMELEGHVVMWELKNYTSLVPKAEVDKFLRDLKENAQSNIGVMISKSTDIHGKNGGSPLICEFDGDNMMIYINRFEEFCGEDEHKVFSMLMGLFRIWWEYHREENNGFDRVEIIRELERAVEEMAKRRTDWKRHRAHLEEIGRWTTDLIDECEDRIDRILKKVRNVSEVTAPFVMPEGVFRESGEEKERIWVTSIMKVCVPGEQIEVRELVTLLQAHHKLSADTIRSNIMAILRDSAVIKKGIVKYVKGISKFVPPCQIQMP